MLIILPVAVETIRLPVMLMLAATIVKAEELIESEIFIEVVRDDV